MYLLVIRWQRKKLFFVLVYSKCILKNKNKNFVLERCIYKIKYGTIIINLKTNY